MKVVKNSYRGLSLLMDLNWDRALYIGTVTLALGFSAALSTTFG